MLVSFRETTARTLVCVVAIIEIHMNEHDSTHTESIYFRNTYYMIQFYMGQSESDCNLKHYCSLKTHLLAFKIFITVKVQKLPSWSEQAINILNIY